jgi:hypothetical protein
MGRISLRNDGRGERLLLLPGRALCTRLIAAGAERRLHPGHPRLDPETDQHERLTKRLRVAAAASPGAGGAPSEERVMRCTHGSPQG